MAQKSKVGQGAPSNLTSSPHIFHHVSRHQHRHRHPLLIAQIHSLPSTSIVGHVAFRCQKSCWERNSLKNPQTEARERIKPLVERGIDTWSLEPYILCVATTVQVASLRRLTKSERLSQNGLGTKRKVIGACSRYKRRCCRSDYVQYRKWNGA